MNKLYRFVFVIIAVFVFGSFSSVVRADAANGTLSVDSIVPEQTEALAGGGFENGWKWDFYITIPSNENVVSLKFDDWTNGTETIPASNVRYYSASSTNASTANSAIQVATSSVYADSLGIAANNPASATSTQIMVVVEVSVPENIDGGSFSTNYSVQSAAPTSTSISIDKNSLIQTYSGTAKTVNVISAASTTVTYVAVDPQNQLPASSPFPVDAGVYNVTATINDPRYIAASTTDILVINPAPITIVASGTTKEYDATSTSFAVLTATGTFNKDLLTVNATQSYDSKDVGNRIINISQINIIPQGSNTKLTNYYCSGDVLITLPQCGIIVATTTGSITPVHLTVSASTNGAVFNGDLSKSNDASSYISLTPSVSNQINPVFSIDKDIVATSTSAVFVDTGAGAYDVDVSGIYLETSTNSGNYYVDNSTTTIKNFPVNGGVPKQDPLITFSATSTTVNFGDTVTYLSTNTNMPIYFYPLDQSIATVSSSTITFVGTSTSITITAHQDADSNYNSTSTSTTFTIN